MDGNKLTYDGPVSTPTADLTMTKFHWNSILSTLDAKYFIVDAKNFCPDNTMKNNKYYRIFIKLIPQEIVEKYDLNRKKFDSYIYVRFEKGMYGQIQAGIIANEVLKTHLKPHRYAPA